MVFHDGFLRMVTPNWKSLSLEIIWQNGGMTAKWYICGICEQWVLIQQLASSGMKTFPDADNSCISIPTALNYVRNSGGCQAKDTSRLVLISHSYFLGSYISPDFLFLGLPFPDFLAQKKHLAGEGYVHLSFSLVLISFSSTFFFCPGYFLCPHCGLQVHTLSLELFSAIALCVEEDPDVLVTAPPYSTKPPSHKVTGHAHTFANLCDKYTHAHFRVPPRL